MVHFDAIVLGAGISGLGAGKELKAANMNFLILEGSDRVGGRINTVEMLNLKEDCNCKKVFVDAGAQWIHGRSNELFRFAENFDLIHPELSEEAEGDFIREDGSRLDDFFVKKVDFKFGQILKECEAFVKLKAQQDFQFPASIEDFLSEKFKPFISSLESSEERRHAMQLLDWHRKFVSIEQHAKSKLCLNVPFVYSKSSTIHAFTLATSQQRIGGTTRSTAKAARLTSMSATA